MNLLHSLFCLHLYWDNPCSFRQSSSTADRTSQQPDLRLYTPHNYHRSCQADITGFSQHLPPAIQSLYSHMWVPDRLNTLSSLHATTTMWHKAVTLRHKSVTVRHKSVTILHKSLTRDTYLSPYTVSKHHKPPRRDGRSQVTAGQLRCNVSSAESSLSPPIKTDRYCYSPTDWCMLMSLSVLPVQ